MSEVSIRGNLTTTHNTFEMGAEVRKGSSSKEAGIATSTLKYYNSLLKISVYG